MKFSNKKKILFVISDFGPGGAQRVLSNLANSLVNKEYDVYTKTINMNNSRYLLIII